MGKNIHSTWNRSESCWKTSTSGPLILSAQLHGSVNKSMLVTPDSLPFLPSWPWDMAWGDYKSQQATFSVHWAVPHKRWKQFQQVPSAANTTMQPLDFWNITRAPVTGPMFGHRPHWHLSSYESIGDNFLRAILRPQSGGHSSAVKTLQSSVSDDPGTWEGSNNKWELSSGYSNTYPAVHLQSTLQTLIN